MTGSSLNELRIYPPSSPNYIKAQPVSLYIGQAAGFPTELTAAFVDRWEQYRDDADPANAVQSNALVENWRADVCTFRGKIKVIQYSIEGGKPTITIQALCKLQTLNETYAIYDDGDNWQYAWMRETPELQLTQVALHAAHDYGDGFRNVWYPDPTSAAWLSASLSNSSTLGAAVTALSPANGGRLQLAQTHGGLPPAGFISMGSEWIEYNGYALDTADGYWYAHDVRRASLGTSATTGSIGDNVYARFSKRINPRGRILVEAFDTDASLWHVVPANNHLQPNLENGGFAFSQSPLGLVIGNITALRATYQIHDEEGGSELTLSTVLTDVLSGDPAFGGSGFGGLYTDQASVEIDAALDDIKLARVKVPESTKTLDFIKGLLNEARLMRGTADDAVILRYDPEADAQKVEYLVQQEDADIHRRYMGATRYAEEQSSELVRTAIVVNYSAALQFNLVSPARMWNTVVADPPGGAVPRGIQKIGGQWFALDQSGTGIFFPGRFNISQNTTAAVGGENTPMNLLTDNDKNSGIYLGWDTLQAAGVHHYSWFPGASATAPDQYFIDKVLISLDVEMTTAAGVAGGGYLNAGIEVVCYETFTGSTTTAAPTLGTARSINTTLAVEFTPGAQGAGSEYVLTAENLYIPARAIGIKVNGYFDADGRAVTGGSGSAFSDYPYGFAINDILVTGLQLKHELVTLTGTYSSSDTSVLVAPESAAKLLDIHTGQHSVGEVTIGASTREVARAFGWFSLLQSLAQSQTRTYEIEGPSLQREGIAQVGETVRINDDFTAIPDTVDYFAQGGRERLVIRAVNYRDDLVGQFSCAQLPPPADDELRRNEEVRKLASLREPFITLR